MTRVSTLFIAVALFSCSKKEEKAGGAAASADEKPISAAAKLTTTKLVKLGRTIDLSGEITVADGMSPDAVMITGPDIGALTVELAKTPQSVNEAQDDAKMYTPRNMTTEIIPPGGWLMKFENTGAAGTSYWVQSRRDLDGKSYKCGTTGSNPEQAKAVAFACKSLK